VAGTSGRTKDIFDPNTGAVQAKLSMATPAELDAAVASAAIAQRKWAQENPQRRSRVLFRYKQLVEENMEAASMLSNLPAASRMAKKASILTARGQALMSILCVNRWASLQGLRPLTSPP